jgi:hypothetical protein
MRRTARGTRAAETADEAVGTTMPAGSSLTALTAPGPERATSLVRPAERTSGRTCESEASPAVVVSDRE